LKALAEACGIPVGETFAGRGALRSGSALLVGGVGATGTTCAGKLAAQADLVICVGTRLSDFTTGSQSLFQNPQVRFLSINVTGHDAHKQGALPLVADAREALRALAALAQEARLKPDATYIQEVATAKKEWDTKRYEACFQQVPGEAMSQSQ